MCISSTVSAIISFSWIRILLLIQSIKNTYVLNLHDLPAEEQRRRCAFFFSFWFKWIYQALQGLVIVLNILGWPILTIQAKEQLTLETIFCMDILRPTGKFDLLDSQLLVWSIMLDHKVNILGSQSQIIYKGSLKDGK